MQPLIAVEPSDTVFLTVKSWMLAGLTRLTVEGFYAVMTPQSRLPAMLFYHSQFSDAGLRLALRFFAPLACRSR